MKKLISSIFLLSASPIFAGTYTITANSVTIHVGESIPPFTFHVSSYSGRYDSLFKGEPDRKITIHEDPAVGSYPIVITAGAGKDAMSTVSARDRLKFVNGVLRVILPSGAGARLSENTADPPGLSDGAAYAMINVKANPVATLAGDGVTDDTENLQALLAWGRDVRRAIVNTDGMQVTSVSGMPFTGISGAVQINGVIYKVASVNDASHLTLTTNAGIAKGSTLRTGGNTVASHGNVITASAGPSFEGLAPNSPIMLDGISYRIATVMDATHLTTTASLPDLNAVKLYAGNAATGWGRQLLQLYFPKSPSCYLVKKQLTVYGNYWTLLGEGPRNSCIRLAANSDAFNQGTKAYLFQTSSVSGNDNFREFIENLGFNIGVGNPQAEAVHWVNNNIGAIRNVLVWNDDSSALYGVGLEGAYPGPTLLKDVAVYGFQYGFYGKGQSEYNVTMEGVTTEGQSAHAIVSGSVKMAIRHWTSDNSVPALATVAGGAHVVVVDSEVFGHDAETIPGFTNIKASDIYGRDVLCRGYNPCEVDAGADPSVTRAVLPSEFWTGPAKCVFCSAPASLRLPVIETPVPVDPPVSTWTKLGVDPATWGQSVARSISPTVYLPPGSYGASTDPSFTVPDSIDHIQMYGSQFNLKSSSRILNISVTGSSRIPLTIDGCLYGSCFITHTGTRTLVLRDSAFSYKSAPGAGDVFFEDAGPGAFGAPFKSNGDGPTFYASQKVWARQLNIETGESKSLLYPKLTCNGCKLWILGYKTEQNSPSLILNDHAQAEVLGFFYYQLHMKNQPQGTGPMYVNDSDLFATGYVQTNAEIGAPCWVVENHHGKTACEPNPDINTPQLLNFYYSKGADQEDRK
jgi:hypothetical protein